jgi:DNA-binding NtrC family response regulator
VARVLVVDDEPIYCDNLKFALSRAGHEVATTSAVDSALAMAERFQPDLLIVDWMLKNQFDGVDVSRSLHSANPALKTILITGFPADEWQPVEHAPSVTRVLEKPFSLADICQLVDQLLD